MLEYAGSHRTGARSRRREAGDLAAIVRNIDWLLLGGVLALVGVGLWAISGITLHEVAGRPHYFLDRQAVYAGVGLVGLCIAVLVDPDVYRRYWRAIFGVTVVVILLVFAVGPVTRGSRRWLNLGFFTFQPSEFGKLLFVLAIAGFLAERSRRIAEPGTTLRTVGLGAIAIVLVFVEPDFGTALVYGAALAAALFVAGTRWLHLAALGAATVIAALLVVWILPSNGVHVLKPYQQQRLVDWTHPSADPSNATYNIEQSITAVASGQMSGRGVAGATQTNLDFLPAKTTDFVFASYGEERGFVGAILLLALYLLVVWRGLRVVTVAGDLYSSIVAGGIVVAFLFQVFVNAGMTMGIAPITGIPLPFVSVGGSSMIANLVAMGVLLAIHTRGRARRRR